MHTGSIRRQPSELSVHWSRLWHLSHHAGVANAHALDARDAAAADDSSDVGRGDVALSQGRRPGRDPCRQVRRAVGCVAGRAGCPPCVAPALRVCARVAAAALHRPLLLRLLAWGVCRGTRVEVQGSHRPGVDCACVCCARLPCREVPVLLLSTKSSFGIKPAFYVPMGDEDARLVPFAKAVTPSLVCVPFCRSHRQVTAQPPHSARRRCVRRGCAPLCQCLQRQARSKLETMRSPPDSASTIRSRFPRPVR
jgi:hypothetical protein